MSFGTHLLHTPALLTSLGVGTGMQVADFGIGRTGHIVVHAGQMVGESGKVFAVDIVPDVLDSVCRDCSRRGLGNVERVWGDFERALGVPIADRSVDVVTCVNNLWVVGKPQQMFAEAVRILRPGGTLAIVDWRPRSAHPAGPPLGRRVQPIHAQRWLSGLGIDRVEERRVGDHHWALVCRIA